MMAWWFRAAVLDEISGRKYNSGKAFGSLVMLIILGLP